jgi:hypothetical protein
VSTETRRAALAALGANRDGWMPGFFTATAAIARAVADGRITEEQLRAYPADASYPVEQSAALAAAAGYDDDDAEAVGIAVQAITALTVGDVGIGEGTWYFEDETELCGLTLAQLRAECSGQSLREAAAMVLAADAEHRTR